MSRLIRRILCRHEVDKLRFVRKIHGDEINILDGKRYEYSCVCGSKIVTSFPLNCEGCRHLDMYKCGVPYCRRGINGICE